MSDFMGQPILQIRNLGFTGTQKGMTPEQRLTVHDLMQELGFPMYAHHGDCIGADSEFHDLTRMVYGEEVIIVGHPCDIFEKRAFRICDVWRDVAPPLERNRKIVDECDYLIAASGTPMEMVRSGTWATIRYARKQNVTCKVVLPDGSFDAS